MKYIIRCTDSNPDGGTCGTMYFLAETEREMERICNAFSEGSPYTTVTCLGPIMKLPKWMKDVVEKHV